MTTKRSKNPRPEVAEEVDENDHNHDSRSSESIDSSTESSPLETDDGYQIRQHALELLHSFPERNNPQPGNIANGITRTSSPIHASGYQSYHDSPNIHTTPVLSFTDFDATASAPSVGDLGNDERGLTLAGVATMAFACVATCLTESYRAASNYYGGYEGGRYPPVADLNTQNYHHVASYHCESNQTASSKNISNNNSYRDGYQAQVEDGEVMERGISTHFIKNQQTSQMSGETRTQQDEWEKVHVPSTYQRGGTGQ
jgi:hypothetical protein